VLLRNYSLARSRNFGITSGRCRCWHATRDCVVPYVNHILHRDWFWVISTASGSARLWDLRSCCMVLSHVMSGVIEASSSPLEGVDRILLVSVFSSICAMCPKRVRRRDWTIAMSLGCPVSLRTSSFRTNWCHLIRSSICRHYWIKASILHASVLETAQQSNPYRKIGRMHVLYNFSFVDVETRDLNIWLCRLCMAVRAMTLWRLMSWVFWTDELMRVRH